MLFFFFWATLGRLPNPSVFDLGEFPQESYDHHGYHTTASGLFLSPALFQKKLRPTPSGNAEDLEGGGGGARAMSMQQGAIMGGGVLDVFREMSAWFGMSTSRRPYFVHIDTIYKHDHPPTLRYQKENKKYLVLGHYIFPNISIWVFYPAPSTRGKILGWIFPKAEPCESLLRWRSCGYKNRRNITDTTRFLTNEPHLSCFFFPVSCQFLGSFCRKRCFLKGQQLA